MSVFGSYSRYYDLLYRDKDYAREAKYLHELITKYHRGAISVLDLGCGTGRHDHILAENGYAVTGVDLAEEMLAVANASATSLHSAAARPIFLQGDLRSVRLDKTFDVVISLFHAMSYQVTNEDLKSAFATVKAHLKPGGLFLFDCWYGPAVLTDRPAIRIKRLEDDTVFVTRLAEPVMYPDENRVDVHYQVIIRTKTGNEVDELKETHCMRYFFKPEIDLLLSGTGLHIVDYFEWLSGRKAGLDTWSVCFVVRS